MIEWIAIGVLVVFLLLLFRVDHQGRRIKLLIILIIVISIYISIVGFFSSEELDLKSPRGIIGAIYIYAGWVGDTIGGLWGVGKETIAAAGNVVRGNSTDFDQPK
jgi:formate hydrogenlyase subunit 3/multisubunit Na+/H+ antiporter MnhD subunit